MERHTALIKGKFNTKIGVKIAYCQTPFIGLTKGEEGIYQVHLSKDTITIEIDKPQLDRGDKLYLSEKDIVVKIIDVVRTDKENVILYLVEGLYEDRLSSIYDKFLEYKEDVENTHKQYKNELLSKYNNLTNKYIKLKSRTLWQRIWNKEVE